VAQPVDSTDTSKKEPEDVLFEKLPVLHKIMNATEILPETRQELEALLKKKKLTKKDRVIVEDILVNLYVDSTMFKSDKPELRESKKSEIKEILDSI
jgi:chromatin segregation and condensation protein Rec8/ScpA/Scc1 (kleisin family)